MDGDRDDDDEDEDGRWAVGWGDAVRVERRHRRRSRRDGAPRWVIDDDDDDDDDSTEGWARARARQSRAFGCWRFRGRVGWWLVCVVVMVSVSVWRGCARVGGGGGGGGGGGVASRVVSRRARADGWMGGWMDGESD